MEEVEAEVNAEEEEVNEEIKEEVVEDEGGGGSRCWKEEKA